MWSVKNQTMWLLAKLAGYFSYQTRVMQVQVYNLGQNICRLFHFLAQFVFTSSETELDYRLLRVVSRAAERLKDLRI